MWRLREPKLSWPKLAEERTTRQDALALFVRASINAKVTSEKMSDEDFSDLLKQSDATVKNLKT